MIALADQDDRWDSDKLDLMIAELDSTPSALLAYSDVRIADAAGNVLSDTYFFERRNNPTSMASMLVTNNVTGAASLFRRELLETALPFPPGGTGQELYHDHWLALCALAQGPLVYVDRPTHDYTRHDASVTLTEADGHWVAPPRGRLGAARMRARRFGRRLRLASRSPGWRSAYTGRYLLIRQLGAILLLRLGRDGIAPQHLRDIDRLMAAETSPRAALWLLARSFRPWIGRNDTLARERVIFGGILWRKLVGRRRVGARRRCASRPRDPAGRLLALVLPVGGLAEAGGLDHLEAEHRALHPRGGDVDPEQVEDGLLRHPQDLLAAHAGELVGQQRGRGGRDRAALALEAHLRDAVVLIELDEDVLLVAAERVGVLVVEVEGVEPAEVVRPLVVLEDLIAVELVHRYSTSKTRRASWRPSTRRSISPSVV